MRQIVLADAKAAISEDQSVERLSGAVRPETRALALTRVHSGTGLELPLRPGVIATVTPYATRDVRLAPSIRNSPDATEAALREIRTSA